MVSKDETFTLIEGEKLQEYLDKLEVDDNNPVEGEGGDEAVGGEAMEET